MESRRSKDFFSDNFKDLFIKMVQLKLEDRLSMDEIKKHPWMQEEVPTKEDVKKSFQSRKKKMKEAKAEEEKVAIVPPNRAKPVVRGGGGIEQEGEPDASKEIQAP